MPSSTRFFRAPTAPSGSAFWRLLPRRSLRNSFFEDWFFRACGEPPAQRLLCLPAPHYSLLFILRLPLCRSSASELPRPSASKNPASSWLPSSLTRFTMPALFFSINNLAGFPPIARPAACADLVQIFYWRTISCLRIYLVWIPGPTARRFQIPPGLPSPPALFCGSPIYRRPNKSRTRSQLYVN